MSRNTTTDSELLADLLSEFGDSNDSNDFDAALGVRIPVNYEYIEGFRQGSKIVWVKEGNRLFYRNTWSRRENALACTCYDPNCNARIFIRNDGTAFRLFDSIHDSQHGSFYTTYKHMMCFTKLKESVLKAPASTKISEIYKKVILEWVSE